MSCIICNHDDTEECNCLCHVPASEREMILLDENHELREEIHRIKYQILRIMRKMNPDTKEFEKLLKLTTSNMKKLLRPDGTEVPDHWAIFTQGETVVIKDTTFKIAYIGEKCLVLEPAKIPIIDDQG